MSDSSLCAEITWKIENILNFKNDSLDMDSEKFVVNTLNKSSWYFQYLYGEIYLIRADEKQGITVKVEIAVLGADNKPQHVTETTSKTYLSEYYSEPLIILLHTIRDNPEKYLRGNIFTIRCRMWLPENKNETQIARVTLLTGILEGGDVFNSNMDKFLDTTNTFEIHHGNNSRNTLLKDTLCMYRDGTMSDFSIQVKGRTFPVNAFILASRSPVFHRMLQTNMKEKTEKILKLDELDENTVCQMLEYMYSDDPGELTTDSALKLYFVGDQYQMLGLKAISVQYLRQNITSKNACDIFQLADQHNNSDLKTFATQFILLHEKEIVLSDEFEILSASNQNLILKELTKLRLQ